MKKEFHSNNRQKLYQYIQNDSIVLFFSGKQIRKTNDEYYPFYTNRSFLYLTGLDSQDFIFLAKKHENTSSVEETIYILPSDPIYERWNGKRLKINEVLDQSGILNIVPVDRFENDLHRMIQSGDYKNIFLDFDKLTITDPDDIVYQHSQRLKMMYPYINICNSHSYIKAIRTIKEPCEIEAMKKAQLITAEAVTAMMKASKPGMYEYQYKAEFDYVLGQYGPDGPAFPPIISAGHNNFCIHYYSYTGQAMDGDMILNDVGAWHDNLMNDVSRGFPCNGRFSERQKQLYTCAFNTSEHMFGLIKPGMAMSDVDLLARKFNFEQLKDLGLLEHYEDAGKLIWHGGAHHVGYDVHDVVDMSHVVAPGMVFCVDIGIYCEEWGIGFRLEDNCLVTENGCINLSANTPRSIQEIEDTMMKRTK